MRTRGAARQTAQPLTPQLVEQHVAVGEQPQVRQAAAGHIWLFPLDDSYRKTTPHAQAVVTTCGVMGPAELLHLGRPFVAYATPGHGEHAFNGAALREMSGVVVIDSLSDAAAQRQVRAAVGAAKHVVAPLQ